MELQLGGILWRSIGVICNALLVLIPYSGVIRWIAGKSQIGQYLTVTVAFQIDE